MKNMLKYLKLDEQRIQLVVLKLVQLVTKQHLQSPSLQEVMVTVTVFQVVITQMLIKARHHLMQGFNLGDDLLVGFSPEIGKLL